MRVEIGLDIDEPENCGSELYYAGTKLLENVASSSYAARTTLLGEVSEFHSYHALWHILIASGSAETIVRLLALLFWRPSFSIR